MSERRAVLWDSSAILAMMDDSDANHQAALKAARHDLLKLSLFVTNYSQAEAHALILSRMGRIHARGWLFSSIPVWRVTPEEEALARKMVIEHEDKSWSLCDCMSFAVIESRGALGAFTFDDDFRQRGRFKIFGLRTR